MPNALTTKERVKDRLKITSTEFDTLINNLITGVTARMEKMCNRSFTLATYTNEIHDGADIYGTARKFLITKNAPITAITSIEYRGGLNTAPMWTTIGADYYDADMDNGIIRLHSTYAGMRNLRITYTAGWDGFGIGLTTAWVFNAVPTGATDGSNRTFTLPEPADQVVVYADQARELPANVTFTPGASTFTLAAGRAPHSAIAVDYLRSVEAESGTPTLPMELVDVAERAVVYLFKMRDVEGRTTESFQESSVTWRQNVFTPEMLATIKNYRRGYNL